MTWPRFLEALRTRSDPLRVVDVGAHIGIYTLEAARRVGPQGHVYAIEPDATNVALLRKNLRVNHLRNVTVLPFGAGKDRGRRTLHLAEDPHLGSMLNTFYPSMDAVARRRAEVPVERIDDHLTGPVDLVKIDVEGAELEAFEGMRTLLHRSPRVQLCMEYNPDVWRRAGYEPHSVLPFLQDCGFRMITVLDEGHRTAFPLESVSQWPERAWWNLWAAKPES